MDFVAAILVHGCGVAPAPIARPAPTLPPACRHRRRVRGLRRAELKNEIRVSPAPWTG